MTIDAKDTAVTERDDRIAIEITDMHKWFGRFHVLKDINLTVERGERIVICGPSGSGKSTLIRCINHLEEHQRGNITVDGISLTDNLKNIAEIRREGRHGVSAVQSVSTSYGPAKLHTGANLGEKSCPDRRLKKPRCGIWRGYEFRNRRRSTPVSCRAVNSNASQSLAACA